MTFGSRFVTSILAVLAFGSPVTLHADDSLSLVHGVVKVIAEVDGKRRIGSGIVVRREDILAYVVTASHVIEGDPRPQVEFYARRNQPVFARPVALEGGDPRGLATLMIEEGVPEDVNVLMLDPEREVRPGDVVSMIGFPRLIGTPWAMTKGELVGRTGKDLVLSGAVDEGNSGGPLIKDDRVVGIITEASPPFAYAAPAVIAQYVLESWGVRFGVRLRAQAAKLSPIYLRESIRRRGFHHPYDGSSEGLSGSVMGSIGHTYSVQNRQGESVVVDFATGLMWQQAGSKDYFWKKKGDQDIPESYVDQLNQSRHAGYTDWRLPTFEELASLLEPVAMNEGLFIASVFGSAQRMCWTGDTIRFRHMSTEGQPLTGDSQMFVDFETGVVSYAAHGFPEKVHVRAVRSMTAAELRTAREVVRSRP